MARQKDIRTSRPNAPRPRQQAPARTPAWAAALSAGGALVARHPVPIGGSAIFFAAFMSVAINAIWYQPHAHHGAFFATREFASPVAAQTQEPETTFLIDRSQPETSAPAPSAPASARDTVTAKVQGALKELGFYAGQVDGLAGPATYKAIDAYRKKVGLTGATGIDADLLDKLDIDGPTGSIGRPAQTAPASGAPSLKQVQAALKAFNAPDMSVDGVPGAKTRTALQQFQQKFGLTVTGEVDPATVAKMREQKLLN